MKLQKYFPFLINLLIIASICFGSPYSVSAQSQSQAPVIIETISPPLFSNLTWKNFGNIQKYIYANGQSLALNGDMFEAIENFQNEIPESVFDYYSKKNMQSLGWNFVSNSGFESTYWHESGRYLIVRIMDCPNSETNYCVNVWQSVDANSTPPSAAELSNASIIALVAFNKITPANGSSIANPATTYRLLQWSDAEIGSTDRYEYCIDETNNGQCDIENWITRNSLYSGGPGDFIVLQGHTYYWQVRVRDAGTYANGGTWWKFTILPTGPSVSSIVRFNPITSTTSASSVIFTVTFNSAVTGVDASDFTLATTGVSGASVSSVSGSGSTYAVSVNTGTGDGTIRLDVVDNDSIKDSQNIPLGGAGANNGNFTSGQVYIIDKGPIVLSSVRTIATPVNLISLSFTVTFSEYVTGVDVNDFILAVTGITGASITSVSGSGSVYTVKVNSGYGNGTIRLIVSDNDTIIDSGQNPLNGGYSSGQFYTINKNIEAYVGGSLLGAYGLSSSQSIRDNYSGIDNGPVKVISTSPLIVASIRDAWAVNGVITSFSQLMGLPLEQLSDKYVFPGYNNVTLNDQLRIANVDPLFQSTAVKITIGGVVRGTYTLVAGDSVRINYAGLDSGPVVVEGTPGVKIISAIREAWSVNGVIKSFVQLMGLPAAQLSNKYVFPAYNNVTVNEQLRIGNVDPANPTTVTVTIGGVVRGTYPLAAGQAVRINYAGLDSGPVVVEGSPSTVPIISSIRSAWSVNGVITSFAQLMGMPAEQLSNKYVFPGYNNVTLNEQLRIANVDTNPTTVTVTIGGVLRGTYPLAAGAAVRINYASLDSGPVVVEGTPGVKIISAIREAWSVNGAIQSFVQLMGLPSGQLSTTYLFPAYNNVTLNEQLRIGVP